MWDGWGGAVVAVAWECLSISLSLSLSLYLNLSQSAAAAIFRALRYVPEPSGIKHGLSVKWSPMQHS